MIYTPIKLGTTTRKRVCHTAWMALGVTPRNKPTYPWSATIISQYCLDVFGLRPAPTSLCIKTRMDSMGVFQLEPSPPRIPDPNSPSRPNSDMWNVVLAISVKQDRLAQLDACRAAMGPAPMNIPITTCVR